MQIKTSETTPIQLNYLVAKCEGASPDTLESYIDGMREADDGNYSTNWAQGGPIIEREGLTLTHQASQWAAQTDDDVFAYGPTPLIAAMRCYVASQLGDTVDVPEELINV
jgi:hypothetical protein